MEYKTTEELVKEAREEMKGFSGAELQEIERNAAYHSWYRNAASDELMIRSQGGQTLEKENVR